MGCEEREDKHVVGVIRSQIDDEFLAEIPSTDSISFQRLKNVYL